MTLIGKTIQARTSPVILELANSDGKAKKIPTFSMEAYTGGMIFQPFTDTPIVVDLAGLTIPDRAIPIRMNHSRSEGVGHTSDVRIKDPGGLALLVASGTISRSTPAALDVIESSRNGFPWQSSISASIQSIEEIKEGSVVVNGRSFDAPLLIMRKTTLEEISFVDLGADDQTSASIAAAQNSQKVGETMEPKEPENKAKTIEASTPETKPKIEAAGAVKDLGDLRARANIDAERHAKIKASAERVVLARPDLANRVCDAAEEAIQNRIDASDFALEMLRLERDYGVVGGARADRSTNGKTIEAALCVSGGMRDDSLSKNFDADTLEMANDQYRNGLSLNDAIMIMAQRGGFNGVSVKSDPGGALRAAMSIGMIQANSTLSLPSILSNVAGKFLREGFNSVEKSWESIASIGTARDFKLKTTNTLVGDYTARQLGKSGEIEHGVPGEETYTNQLKTWARMLILGRQAMIDDDTGALTEVPRKLGRGQGLAFNTDFWAEWLDDADFFKVGNLNYLSGGGSVLSVTALTSALTLLMTQTDPDGNPLGLMSGDLILLVPYALLSTAKQLVSSMEIRDPSAGSAFGVANPHAGQFQVVASQYLTSSTAWYVMAKPSVLPAIEASFLNGNRTPIIESEAASFDTLGIQFRMYHDFGNSKQEYRAAVKMAGA